METNKLIKRKLEIFAVSPDLSQSVDGIYANDRCLVIRRGIDQEGF